MSNRKNKHHFRILVLSLLIIALFVINGVKVLGWCTDTDSYWVPEGISIKQSGCREVAYDQGIFKKGTRVSSLHGTTTDSCLSGNYLREYCCSDPDNENPSDNGWTKYHWCFEIMPGSTCVDGACTCPVQACEYESECDQSGGSICDFAGTVCARSTEGNSCTIGGYPGTCTSGVCVKSCDCTTGVCCDGCDYRPSSYLCNNNYQTEYGCPWGTSAGYDVGRRYRDQYCSGTSASCTGSSVWESWTQYDNCASCEYCTAGDPICNSYCLGTDTSCGCTSCTNCDNSDGWYDTGSTQWVSSGECTEKEQKEQRYRNYYCLGTSCTYSTGSTQWVDTGNTRNKVDGISCSDDGNSCTDDYCSSGSCIHPLYCLGTVINCGCTSCVSCDSTNDFCDAGGGSQSGHDLAETCVSYSCQSTSCTSCFPYMAASTISCKNSCAEDSDCWSAYHCDGSSCIVDVANGQTCDEDSDCQSNNCRKDIDSLNDYCADSGKECSQNGADGYDTGETYGSWICSAQDSSVQCLSGTLCDTYAGKYCDSSNWQIGNGTSYDCSATDHCVGETWYTGYRCNGGTGTAGTCSIHYGAQEKDSSVDYCTSTATSCTPRTWFYDLGTSTSLTYDWCCGDDGSSDDWATYSGSLTTSTSSSCRRCLNGEDQGILTLYGNGNLSGSGTSRTCYYGDIGCTASSASDGTSAIIYGWGWYTGTLTTSPTVECRSDAGTCLNGSFSSDSITTLYGNGYISGSICSYGNITCASGSEVHGASCTLDPTDICGDGIACHDCTPYQRVSTIECYTSCADDSQCTSDYYCSGSDCVLKKTDGQSCASDSECASNNCDLDFDLGIKYCHATETSCVDYSPGNPWEQPNGYELCSGNNWYKSCSSSVWGSQINCDTTVDNEYTDADNCGWKEQAADTCFSASSGGCIAPAWVEHDCSDFYTTSIYFCNYPGELDYCRIACGADCVTNQTNDTGIDYCNGSSDGDVYNEIDTCGIELDYYCMFIDDGTISDTLVQDCGIYDCIESGSSAYCLTACSFDTDCNTGFHCDESSCLADLGNGLTCDEDSDCISGDCGTKPDESRVCIDSQYECVNMIGDGVFAGYEECYNNLVYNCAAEDIWTSSLDGDPAQFDCECVLADDYSGECSDASIGCWDSFSYQCCGDDDNVSDYFWSAGHGGCVNRFETGTADKQNPSLVSISSAATDYHSYVPATSTTGTIYFNSNLAQEKTINFNVNWNDTNENLGYDYLDAIKVSGLIGTITPKTGTPPKTLDYTFSSLDNSGSLMLYVRDAVHLNDSTVITFIEDTEPPVGSIIINDGDTYADSTNALLSLTYSDNISVRDCAYNNDDTIWSEWESCETNKSWRILPADGIREVYYKVRDLAGNTYITSDSIILDRTKPGIVINNDAVYTNITDVILSLDFDFTGDPVECSFKNDNLGWTAWSPCPLTPNSVYPELAWVLDDVQGDRTVSIRVNTSLGIIKEAEDDIIYDSLPPDGSIEIYSIGIPGFMESNEEYTAYTTVNLILEYDDSEVVAGCRFANDENNEANFTSFRGCASVETWILNDEEGLRTVYYQIIDAAGNIREYNDTIYLNKTGAGLDVTHPSAAIVVDDGDWTNDSTMLHATWHGAYDRESEILTIPLVYEYSISTSPGATDVVNWTYTGTPTDVTHTGLDLSDNQTYYINVRVINSAGLTNDSSSNGIIVDTIPPEITGIFSSHDEGIWNDKSRNNDPAFNWTSQDTISGVTAYSYILDQNAGTVPDTIPEGQIDLLYDETSVFYTNIIDGVLYFHLRCKDNASNWGYVEHYEIRVDASPPTTPQMSEPNVTANASHLTYSWTTSYDPDSPPVEYYFELSNSSEGYDPENLVNWTWTDYTNVTVYGLVPDLTYYARVLARNQANGTSQWSSNVSTVFDQSGPDINIIIPGNLGVCNLKSQSPVIRVVTDEDADCSFMENSSMTFDDFDYTDSRYHESMAAFMSVGKHTINVKCMDEIGNKAEKNRTFNITPDARISIDNITFKDVYYTNRLVEIEIRLADKLGGVDGSYFIVELDARNLTLEEFAVTDIGCGKYTISLDAPIIAGSYPITITANASSISSTLNVIDLNLTITYSSAFLSQQGEYEKITYAEEDNTSIGIATDSYLSNISNIFNTLELVSNSFDGNTYIFATKEGANIRARDRMLDNKEFWDAHNPSFGTLLETDTYRTELSLSYQNTTLSGVEEMKAGRYKLFIRKVGVDAESGNSIIEIKVSE